MTEQRLHTPKYIADLIAAYLTEEITAPQQEELDRWLNASGDHQRILDSYMDEEALLIRLFQPDMLDGAAAWEKFVRDHPFPEATSMQNKETVKKPGAFRRFVQIAAVFLIIAVLVGSVSYILLKKESHTGADNASVKMSAVPLNPGPSAGGPGHLKKDLSPGRKRGFITLADKTILRLEDYPVGLIRRQGPVSIFKSDSGIISYQGPGGVPGDSLYNGVSTPPGGWYEVRLPDDSKVYLNAASSIRFPVVFSGKKRVVELEGEAWFEVSPKKDLPFCVQLKKGEQITVTGTAFNVTAYPGDSLVRTTLSRGAVHLDMIVAGRKGPLRVSLRPGSQSVFNRNTGRNDTLADEKVIKAAFAWKEGRYDYYNASLQTIVQELQRWYNVKINSPELPDERFTISGSRSENASTVLDQLVRICPIKYSISDNEINISQIAGTP